MIFFYITKLSFAIFTTNISFPKIDDLSLKIYEISTIEFLIKNKFGKIGFFKKLFISQYKYKYDFKNAFSLFQ